MSLPLERVSNPEMVAALCPLRLRRRRVDSKPPARVLARLGEVAGGASAAVLARTRQKLFAATLGVRQPVARWPKTDRDRCCTHLLVVLVQRLHERHVSAARINRDR